MAQLQRRAAAAELLAPKLQPPPAPAGSEGGREALREWQAPLSYQRAPREQRAATIGGWSGGGAAMGGATEWAERSRGFGHPGVRAV